MTIQELQMSLGQCASPEECSTFVNAHFQSLARLFYDLDQATLTKTKCHYQDAFQALASGSASSTIQRNEKLPPGVTALLILFAAVFERTNLHGDIGQVADILRTGHLCNRIRAMYRFKDITDTTRDYRDRFSEIMQLLESTWQATKARDRAQCEDLAIEFFTTAVVENRVAGYDVHHEFVELFTRTATRTKYQMLCGARITAVLALPPDRLPDERDEASIRTAEAFYDEAARLISHRAITAKGPFSITPCGQHAAHCVDGLHTAKVEIANKYPTEFTRTGIFIQQSLTTRVYTPFTDADQCMRYLRQYMPLHMPQLEQAVLSTLRSHRFNGKHIRVLDIGSGPGTLFCVLSALQVTHPNDIGDFTFEYCPLDPSGPFIEFFKIIADNVQNDRIKPGSPFNCKVSDLDKKDLRSIDWFFVANAITPLIAHAGDIGRAVAEIHRTVTSSVAPGRMLTIAENTASTDFADFCEALVKTGDFAIAQDATNCDGQWLTHCKFYVTGRFRPTRPRLRLATCTTPKGLGGAK